MKLKITESQTIELLEALYSRSEGIKDLICQSDEPRECEELFHSYDIVKDLINTINICIQEKEETI